MEATLHPLMDTSYLAPLPHTCCRDTAKFAVFFSMRYARQTTSVTVFDDVFMEVPANVEIAVADTLNDGLVIKFTDGRCAFYSTLLLYKTLDLAVEQDESSFHGNENIFAI